MAKRWEAVNWNRPDDAFTLPFWNQNVMQFWTDEEIPLSDDKMCWMQMSEGEQEAYLKVLAGLTLLDTVQGDVGMPRILDHVDGLQRKAVLSFMSMMEQIHAKSYSSIFTTLADTAQIDALFRWVEEHPRLQRKAELITKYYNAIHTPKDLYLAMAASVMLESCLFYSGFFYPLYLAGHGKMTNCGEVIHLILRDESIHGLYVGALAQEIHAGMPDDDRRGLETEVGRMLDELVENERAYTEDLYAPIGLVDEVHAFVRYNANKAMMNLGLDPLYPEEDIHPVVLNGIQTGTKHHDFFSQKGNGYVRALRVEPLRDEDFIFS